MKLLNDVYAYVWSGKDNNCNTFVFANVLDKRRHLVIDPGHLKTPAANEPAIERLLTEMQGDDLDPAAIGMVVLTHCHPDHAESAIALREELKIPVALHQAESAIYSKMGGKVDLFLGEGDLELGRKKTTKLKIFHSPGHSPGHITIYWPQEKVLVAGDLIFHRSTGRTDLPGGSMEQLKQSIERLSTLDISFVLCGHPYGHPGVLEGKAEVQQNFEFIKTHILR